MPAEIELWDLAAPAFQRALAPLVDVYAAAMAAPPVQLPGREASMAGHTLLPGFCSVAAVTAGGERAVGFAYGFLGRPGQWWYDTVTAALREHDTAAVPRWFAEPFEVAELHVHPDWQGRGLGRALLERLTAARRERTAVLSTRCGDSPARRLYHSCGFAAVLPVFYFPGLQNEAFAIMAAPLPLREPRSRPGAGRSRGWPSTG